MQIINLSATVGSLTAAQFLALAGAAPGNVTQTDQVEWSYSHVPGPDITTPSVWPTNNRLFDLRIDSSEGMRVTEEPSTLARVLEIVGQGHVAIDLSRNSMKYVSIGMVPASHEPIQINAYDRLHGSVIGTYATTLQDNGQVLKLLCSKTGWITIRGIELYLHSVTTFN